MKGNPAMAIKKILIVDDSATDRQFLSDLLAKKGYSVSTAENAEDAFKKVKASRPDLVLMDVVMPGQNGFQATRTLTKDEETKNIPVILCTSKGQETDKVWGMRQGARDYVVKPVNAADLLAKIAALG
jgi:twitching motility two-component system response regulator PilH